MFVFTSISHVQRWAAGVRLSIPDGTSKAKTRVLGASSTIYMPAGTDHEKIPSLDCKAMCIASAALKNNISGFNVFTIQIHR